MSAYRRDDPRRWATARTITLKAPCPIRRAALPPHAKVPKAPPAAEVHFKGCDDLPEDP